MFTDFVILYRGAHLKWIFMHFYGMLTGYEWNTNGTWLWNLPIIGSALYRNMAQKSWRKDQNFCPVASSPQSGAPKIAKLANITTITRVYGIYIYIIYMCVCICNYSSMRSSTNINQLIPFGGPTLQVSLHGLCENGRANRGQLHEERRRDGRRKVPIHPGGVAWQVWVWRFHVGTTMP